MLLADALARLRKNRVDTMQSARGMRPLPKDVRYGSARAAAMLATFVFPHYSPNVFMWVDTATRATKCGACGKVIPKDTDRLAVHVISRFELKARNGGKRNSERSYYHPYCFDQSLALGFQPRHSGACYDCGAEPPAGGWTERAWVAPMQDPAVLCPVCAGAKWRYRCSTCAVYFRRRDVKVRYMDDLAPTAAWVSSDIKDGQHYLCRWCRQRYRHIGDYRWIEDAEADQLQVRAELAKFDEYCAAVARGEHPEDPWPDEPLDFDQDLL